nr:hypothetical protein [uncultured Acetobacteroides sp.]
MGCIWVGSAKIFLFPSALGGEAAPIPPSGAMHASAEPLEGDGWVAGNALRQSLICGWATVRRGFIKA